MGIIKSKFKKMEEFDCSINEFPEKTEETAADPRSPTSTITRTPLNEVRAATKSTLISRAANLANISTPINNDLLLIQDKRFKHLTHSFIDPRSPSEGIVRTPIVLKSTEISSIVNTPRILEEELKEDGEEEEDFQKTFVERLSRMSFDDLEADEDNDDQKPRKLPDLIETHFDSSEPVVHPLVTRMQQMSTLDPRSPTYGIDRTPLVFEAEQPGRNIDGVIVRAPGQNTFAEQLLLGEEEEEEVDEEKKESKTEEEKEQQKGEDDEERGTVENPIEDNEQRTLNIPTVVEPQSEVFVEVGQVIYGTPQQITATTVSGPRTPLSCLANRKRGELNGKATGKSPLVVGNTQRPKGKQQAAANSNNSNLNTNELRVMKKTGNAFENTTPRKLIR